MFGALAVDPRLSRAACPLLPDQLFELEKLPIRVRPEVLDTRLCDVVKKVPERSLGAKSMRYIAALSFAWYSAPVGITYSTATGRERMPGGTFVVRPWHAAAPPFIPETLCR
jgi:hypothetical protein